MTKTKVVSPPITNLHFDKHLSFLAKEAVDHNNNHHSPPSLESCHSSRQTAAIPFKYTSNSSRKDLEDLRQLLTSLRVQQMETIDHEEHKFYEDDYKRMMADDWLATRFLLRGKKAFERDADCGQRYKILKVDPVHDGRSQAQNQTTNCELDRRAILSHTIELVKVCARFRFDYRINSLTHPDEFPLEWIKSDGLFSYMPDAVGNPTIYLRVALHRPKLIEAPEVRHLFKRYLLYNLERCDQDLYNRPGKAICCVFDMTNVAFENIDLELTTWMIKSFKSSSPKLICYVIIYNPPWFFTATFKVICNTLLSSSKRQSVKFASGNEILDYIDLANLPPYMRSMIR